MGFEKKEALRTFSLSLTDLLSLTSWPCSSPQFFYSPAFLWNTALDHLRLWGDPVSVCNVTQNGFKCSPGARHCLCNTEGSEASSSLQGCNSFLQRQLERSKEQLREEDVKEKNPKVCRLMAHDSFGLDLEISPSSGSFGQMAIFRYYKWWIMWCCVCIGFSG